MFNPWYILVAAISSCIGMGSFFYGKKQQDFSYMFWGICLCCGSYFVSDPLYLAGLTALLCCGVFWQPISYRLFGPPKKIESIE